MSCDMQNDMCCCKNVLELDKLCADCARVCWLKVKKEWADQIVANDVCSQKVVAKQLSGENVNANTLCAKSASIDSLCVNNLTAVNQVACNTYRAAATFMANNLYTLGTAINWDKVLDDPSGDVTLSPFKYTVEVGEGGYYLFNLHLNVSDLSGSSIINGIPVGVQELLVNGVQFVDKWTPFLGFNNGQSCQFSGLVLLNDGDVVTMDYKVLVLDASSGLMPYVGTVNIMANGSMSGQSFFDIIQLSTMCKGGETPQCPVCPPVEVPCVPVVPPSDCDDCDQPVGMSCAPCAPANPAPKSDSASNAAPLNPSRLRPGR